MGQATWDPRNFELAQSLNSVMRNAKALKSLVPAKLQAYRARIDSQIEKLSASVMGLHTESQSWKKGLDEDAPLKAILAAGAATISKLDGDNADAQMAQLDKDH